MEVSSSEARHIFGPVPSRRLGRSLGIDLVPFKTCTYDCVYCQLGQTTCKTIERMEWVPLEETLSELEFALSSGPDYQDPPPTGGRGVQKVKRGPRVRRKRGQ